MPLVSLNRLWNRRQTAAVLLVTVVVCLFVSNTGVREIRRANEPANFVLVDPQPAVGDWPGWRGTAATNVVPECDPPVVWSQQGNVAWRVDIPGRGHASPAVWGQQLFVTTSEERRQSISLLSLDRETGRSLWQSDLHRGGLASSHAKNSHASASPVCDGRFVYVASAVHDSIWVSAVDRAGRIVWQTPAGPFQSKWGYGSSPTLYKSLVIIAADNKGAAFNRWNGTSYLAALHRQTGEIIWRIERPAGDSFGTPIVAEVAGRDQLLIAGRGQVASYDPATGATLWTCRWSPQRVANTMAFDGDHVFASARFPQPELLCIRADGSGDVTNTHVVWREKLGASEVPAPVVSEGWLYVLGDDGVLTCFEAETGKTQWKRRLNGHFSASPLIAGDHLYCSNELGTTFVIRLGSSSDAGTGEVVAENSLDDGQFASPIVTGDRLYLRTLTGIHCVQESNGHFDRNVSPDPQAAPVAEQPDESRRRL